MTVKPKLRSQLPSERSKPTSALRTFKSALKVLFILVMLVLLDYFMYPYRSSIHAGSYDRKSNGIWLQYTWYFGLKTDSEISTLAAGLKSHQVRDAYFHVRSVAADGSLRFHYQTQAKRLLAKLHVDSPQVRNYAWVYVGDPSQEYGADLSKPAVRSKMVSEAVWLVTQCGFDGVQWDYETCSNGDAGFLALLKETSTALPSGKHLSVASPMWMPGPAARWGWSKAYFSKVASSCDQLAVMCYDSGFVLPRSYVWLLRRQPAIVCGAVRGTRCRIVFGLPTYGDGLRSHNPRAENLRNGIRGLREGLDLVPVDQLTALDGAAPFADYTMDDKDWRLWDSLWLNLSASQR